MNISKSFGQCVLKTTNSGFEQPVILGLSSSVNDNRIEGWRTIATNHWVNIWTSGNFGIEAFEGRQFVELTHNDAGIYQDFNTPYPTMFTIKFSHRGGTTNTIGAVRTRSKDRAGKNKLDVCKLSAGPPKGKGALTQIIKVADGDAWGSYTAIYFVPQGQTTTRFLFEPISSAGGRHSLGNFLDAIEITASNEIEGSRRIVVPCLSSEAKIPVGGIGVWDKDPTNPSNTVVNLASSGLVNLTTISGFTVPGIYKYTWRTGYCTSPLILTVGNKDLETPMISSNSPVRAGRILKLSANTVSNVTYNWTGPNGFTSHQQSPIISKNATLEMSGVYTLVLTVDNCSSPPVSVNVVVNPTTGRNLTAQRGKSMPATSRYRALEAASRPINKPIDGYYKKEIIQNAKMTPYAPIRAADVIYSKRIWREIDLREKMNNVFAAPKSRLVDIILDAIHAGELTAYDPTPRQGDVNGDEFSAVLTPSQVMSRLADSVLVPILDQDGNTIGTKIKAGEFNSDSVIKFRIKEDWMFDKQRSVFEPRIIGIAPMIKIKAAGQSFDDQPAFWIYFPEARPLFATKAIANRKNDVTNLSYDDLFIKRIFSSYIVKESNVEDLRIKDYVEGIDRLYESERIKKELMDYEHDLWTH